MRDAAIVLIAWMTFGLCLLGASLPAPAAAQALIVVNSPTDIFAPTDGRCELREALENANVNTDTTGGDCLPGIGGDDRIHFEIAGPGPHTISLQPARPPLAVLESVTIDGYTQPGAVPNTAQVGSNAVIMIEIESGGGTQDVFVVPTGGSTIRGLVLKNYTSGILLVGNESTGNVVEGNHFDGTEGGAFGVIVVDGAVGNTIGGTTPGARNVFFGHALVGINLDGGATTGNLVRGNYIGTDPSGTVAVGNGIGVVIDNGATGNTIGGTAAGARNVISGNVLHGVQIDGSVNNFVQGNFIGPNAAGGALGNVGEGVVLANGAAGNSVGGEAAGAGNTIAFNGTMGVLLTNNAGTGNAILGNLLFDNGGLGIDLGGNGPTPNDPGDADAGPNNLQNTALLLAAGFTGATTVVRATLNSTPNTSFRLEFFDSPAADPSGFGEGRAFLGFVPAVVTGGAGDVTFGVNVPGDFSGTFITVTVTDPNGNTSEFSNAQIVSQPDLTLTLDDGGVTVPPGGAIGYTLRYANVSAQFVTGVVITETLPANTRFDAAGSTPGWTDAGDRIFTFDLGTLTAGENGAVNFAVIVDDPLPDGVEQITNTAAIADDGAIGPDANPNDNTAADDTHIERPAPQTFDFGDAPDPTYPTRLNSDGARHALPPEGVQPLRLGERIDAEGDGQPTAEATGDDDTGADDEDGVSFPEELIIGQPGQVLVSASAAGLLDAWIDFNVDGDWNDPGEQIFANRALIAGVNGLLFNVPASAQARATFARFRFSSAGGLLPGGPAEDGEVEDYRVVLIGQADLELAKQVDRAEVELGQDVVFTVTLTNRGPGTATDISVTDRLPDGFAFVRAAASQGGYNPDTGVWSVGELLADATATLDVVATVTEAGEHTNTAEVTRVRQPDPDSTPGDGQGDDFGQATVVALFQRFEVAPDVMPFGQTIVFGASAEQTATVRNTGTAPLEIRSIGIEGADAASFVIVRGGEAGTLAPTQQRQVVLQCTPQRLGPLSATLRLVTSAGAATVALAGTGTAPTIEPPAPTSEPLAGQPFDLRTTITEGFEPDERQLFFRLGGQREDQFQARDLTQQGNALLGTIPAEAVTERGVDYFIRLARNGLSFTFPPVGPGGSPAPVHQRVQVARLQAPGAFPAVQYRMASVPLDLQDPTIPTQLFDDYGTYDQSLWRVLRWLTRQDRYAEFEEYDGPLDGARAFWLITREGGGFDVENGQSVDASRAFDVVLNPGFSQVANPFAFAVATAEVRSSGLVQGPFFFDGVEYLLGPTRLEPWEGYFVFNPNPGPVTLTVPNREATAQAAKQASSDELFPEASFLVQLRAEVPERGLRDTQNFAGFAAQAAEGWDPMDLPEPPGIGEHLRLSLVQEGRRLTSAFRPGQAGGGQWDLELAVSPSDGLAAAVSVQVALVERGARPEGYAVYVIDLDEGRVLPGAAFTVALTPARPVRRLRLLVGTEAFAEAHSEGASLVPVDFVLEQNYPNPFHAETVIGYGLSRQSRVELAVYNVLGQRVRTLVTGEQRSGRYEVRWDGLDEAGRPAASGVYVYRLHADRFSSTRTMLLVR